MAAVWTLNWQQYRDHALALTRNFYGSLRVVQTPDRRKLFHGTVEHGAEFLSPSRHMQATTYYGQDSGVGILLREWSPEPKRVAIVGLGAGTLAAYGEPGDVFRFYEINPSVLQLAQAYFYFLRESKAKIELVEGDARLSLERETQPPFDIIVLDAFSGDAIPMHLLTREAMALYRQRLRPGGVIAFHISNDYLDLAPVVRQLAAGAGFAYLAVQNHSDDESGVLTSEWILVTNNPRILDNDAIKLHALALTGQKRFAALDRRIQQPFTNFESTGASLKLLDPKKNDSCQTRRSTLKRWIP